MDKDSKKYHIGVDLGPTSIGIAILDNDGNCVQNPIVSRFKDACDEKTGTANNATRREKRLQRRLLHRKKLKIWDFYKLVEKTFNISDNDICQYCKSKEKLVDKLPYTLYLAQKGLSENLSKDEFINVLSYHLKHIGTFFTSMTKEIKQDSWKTPTERNVSNFLNYGYYRNKNTIDKKDMKDMKDKDNMNNSYSHDEWIAEIERLFTKQEKTDYAKKINYLKFKNSYLEIFNRHRDYRYGPGYYDPNNENRYTDKKILNSQSPYGMITKDGKLRGGKTLFDSLRRNCFFYQDEKCFIKNSTSFELFRALAFLNNCQKETIDHEGIPLNKEEKIKVINAVIAKEIVKPNFKKLEKLLNIKFFDKKDNDKDEKTKMEHEIKFVHTQFMLGLFPNIKLLNNENKLDIELIKKMDSVAEFLYFNVKDDNGVKLLDEQYKKELFDMLKEFNNNSSLDNDKENIVINHFKTTSYSSTSKYSQKALLILLPYFLANDDLNLTEVKLDTKKFFGENLSNHGKTKDEILNDILSPSVKKICRNLLPIMNEIIKKYGKDIGTINIEMPRDNNSKLEKSNETAMKTIWDKEIKTVKEKYADYLNNSENTKKRKGLLMKFRLLYQQDGFDPYDGKKIDPCDLCNHPENYEIDHINAISWSMDDSMCNKVLTTRENNGMKKNEPMRFFLTDQKVLELQPKWEEWYKKPGYDFYTGKKDDNDKPIKINLLKSKYHKLIEKEIDISKLKKKFVGRNLSDTSYIATTALKLVSKLLEQKNLKVNVNYKKDVDGIKIYTVPGKITSFITKNCFYKKSLTENKEWCYHKNRDLFYHHGIDAIAIAYCGLLPSLRNANSRSGGDLENFDGDKTINELKEKIKNSNIHEYYSDEEKTNYNYQLNKKTRVGGQLYNETCYKFKEIGKDKYKLSNFNIMKYDYKGIHISDLKKKIDDWYDYLKKIPNNKYTEKDRLIYDKLCKILESHSGKNNNPFQDYMNLENNTENKIYQNLELKIPSLPIIKISNISIPEKVTSYFLHKNKGIYTSFNWKKIMCYIGKTKNNKDAMLAIPLNIKYSFVKINKNNESYICLNYQSIFNELKKIFQKDIDGNLLSNTPKEAVCKLNSDFEKKYGIRYIRYGEKFMLKEGKECNFIFNNIDYKTGEINKSPKESKIVYVVGYTYTNNRIEVKPISFIGEKRMILTINNFFNTFNVVNIDKIGNIHNVDIKKRFNNS